LCFADLDWSAGRAAIVWDVKRLGVSHAVFPDGSSFAHLSVWEFVWFSVWLCCAADMVGVTDGGLLALAGAGVGPCLEHLEFRSESPDFQLNSLCVR